MHLQAAVVAVSDAFPIALGDHLLVTGARASLGAVRVVLFRILDVFKVVGRVVAVSVAVAQHNVLKILPLHVAEVHTKNWLKIYKFTL